MKSGTFELHGNQPIRLRQRLLRSALSGFLDGGGENHTSQVCSAKQQGISEDRRAGLPCQHEEWNETAENRRADIEKVASYSSEFEDALGWQRLSRPLRV